jgi:hypothetical protein
MPVLESYYDLSPIRVIDQNRWTTYSDGVIPELLFSFRESSLYTPLINWGPWQGRGDENWETELFPLDVDAEEIGWTTNYVTARQPLESRKRKFALARYGDKTQIHKADKRFQQWLLNGKTDWTPIMQAVLSANVLRKHERLSRDAFLKAPTKFFTYAGSMTTFNNVGTNVFDPAVVDAWNLRLGNTGSPIIPGPAAASKVVYMPPGVRYDMMQKILNPSAGTKYAMWKDIIVYQDAAPFLRGEFGSLGGIRFVEVPNDPFGQNAAILYNCGTILKQYAVVRPIQMGDGSPDPETTLVDGIWAIGQKDVTHGIYLENFADGDFVVDDWITIHVRKTDVWGVTGGVNPVDSTAIVRRVVAVDHTNNIISLDRPIGRSFAEAFVGKSVTGNTDGTFYAYVTKGKHISMNLVLGSKEAIEGRVYKPIQFYNPPAVDDFLSVERFTWDEELGFNLGNPHAYEVHFSAVSLAKPGGVIAPA